MDMTRAGFDELVGAYALDACEPEEAAALDAFVAAHPDAAAEVEALRAAAAWLGAAGALEPPDRLREGVLAAAADRVEPLPPADALRAETERFDAFLETLEPGDRAVVTHNGLTVRDLVAHVAIVDEAFVADAGAPAGRFIGAREVEQITRVGLSAATGLPWAGVIDRWRAARRALVALAGRLLPDARAGGYPLASVFVVRAFETWTHHDDVRIALGRRVEPPAPPVLRALAELAVESLPLALAARGHDGHGQTARIVMTGPGGGDWTIACAPREVPAPVPDVVLRVPVVEFCRRFADRVAAHDVPCAVDGDADLARAIVDAAPAFAGL